MNRDAGFSLIEMIVAVALLMAVTAAVFTVINPSHGALITESETADMQQRLRVADVTLYKDLLMAGAGVYTGTHAGALTFYFAPVLPSRQGALRDDPPGTYRSDTITIYYVPPTPAQTTLSSDLAPGASTVTVNSESNCPVAQPLCGFQPGMTVLIFDDTGNHDLFALTSVVNPTATVKVNKPVGAASTTYKAGSKIVQAESHTYGLKADRTTRTYQLMRYDGTSNSDAPLVDNVVGLSFEYDGDREPPRLRKPVTDPSGPWTTYGPRPPALGQQTTAYPPGENCAFTVDAATGLQTPRLTTIGAADHTLTRLTSSQLDASAPNVAWCPDSVNQNRFNANLLRIRRIGVTVRVQAAAAALRGPAGALFTYGGTSTSGTRFVPDQEIRFHVSPRNLNLGR